MATKEAAPRRKPVSKEVEEREARRVGNRVRASRARSSQRLERRYAVVYDIDGPRVRLGMLWFLLAAAALVVGPLPAALVYGSAAALAGYQTARVWRRRKERPNPLVAAGMAGGMVLGACLGSGGGGLGILVGTACAVGAAVTGARAKKPVLTDAGWTVQCALPVGLAAMSMVLLARLDQGSAIALLLLVSAYETGDYIVGSGARNPYEGPVAGIAAVTVITFIVSTLSISAFDFSETWLFGALVAVLAPLGQLFASALLPAAGAPASSLRRLDSLLFAAPVWCVAVGFAI